MPSPDTFSIVPVADLLRRWLVGRRGIVDPFARNSRLGTWRNDLNPETEAESHEDALDFCVRLALSGIVADALLFDPPYSPRQIADCYQNVGRKVTQADTQNARLYADVRTGLDVMADLGTIAISCGWNSAGFGEGRGYTIREILLVAHGGAHNDTIVTVEEKVSHQARLLSPRGDRGHDGT